MRLFSAKLSAFLLLFASGNAFSPALEPVIHFSVGAVAGSVGAVAAYPFDYIKSQLQSEYGKRRYKNGWECAVDTWKKHQSPLIFYKGVGVQILGIAPEKGIKLGVNDVLREMSVAQLQGFPLWAQVLAGGTAGACQVVASSPLEVLKVGLQTSDMDFQQVWTQVGGFKGLFRGAEACIFRDITFTAICFPLYQHWVHELGMNSEYSEMWRWARCCHTENLTVASFLLHSN
jgi:solute carrier family 25 aspartate/glutamate transporter 12/13